MAVPKRKTSKARRDQRSSTWGLKPRAVTACLTCQAPTAPHQVCKDCGHYKGIKVLRTKADRMHKRGEELRARQEQAKTLEGSVAQEQG